MNKDLKERIRETINYQDFYSKYMQIGTINPATQEAMAKCLFHDDKVASLSINLGHGRWKCHGCGAGGDEFGFYEKLKGVDFKTALQEISRDLGISITENRNLLDPGAPLKYHQTLLSDLRLKQYLNEKRGLTDETLKKFKLGYSRAQQSYTIPVYDKDGGLINIKTYRPEPRQYKNTLNGKACLFGLGDMLKSHADVFISEGEFDSMILAQNGFLSVSSTCGANTFKEEWREYFKGRKVRIVYDTDEPGRTGAQKVANILSPVAEEVKTIDLPLKEEEGKDITDYFLNGGTKEQFEALIKAAELIEKDTPISLPEFMQKDIPPIEYYISGLLPKKGKGMISAPTNIGKSLLAQNLALVMTCNKANFLDKFDIAPARVLYFDLEMGESALKERFRKMCAKENLSAGNLYVKYLPFINLRDDADRQVCEKWLADLGIEVLVIDPLGNAWSGNENDQKEVSELTAYLNKLIEQYGISILIMHHWRKATKENKTGGEMAAGSYRWGAWLDCHVTLEGMPTNITLRCQKSRNMPKFSPFLAKINEDTLWFEFIADYERKFDESTLIALFEGFKSDRVAIPQLIEQVEKQGVCSASTVRKLLKETTLFEVDSRGKTHYLVKKGTMRDLLDDVSLY